MLVRAAVHGRLREVPGLRLQRVRLTLVVDDLVISHRHEDHLRDFDALEQHGLFRTLYSNPDGQPSHPHGLLSLVAPQKGVKAFDAFRGRASHVPTPNFRFPDASVAMFCVPYPWASNANDLSLVTFLRTNSFTIVFPGDLEASGWRMLLMNQSFRAYLGATDIFVASHHGRENGYCREVFDICRPNLVIVSDGRRQYDSQACEYGCETRGCYIDGGLRKTLTTRCDGTITIDSAMFGPSISTERSMRKMIPFLALLAAGRQ
jgi:beta-lactamase superfamily II metal-dependent hydrolase